MRLPTWHVRTVASPAPPIRTSASPVAPSLPLHQHPRPVAPPLLLLSRSCWRGSRGRRTTRGRARSDAVFGKNGRKVRVASGELHQLANEIIDYRLGIPLVLHGHPADLLANASQIGLGPPILAQQEHGE